MMIFYLLHHSIFDIPLAFVYLLQIYLYINFFHILFLHLFLHLMVLYTFFELILASFLYCFHNIFLLVFYHFYYGNEFVLALYNFNENGFLLVLAIFFYFFYFLFFLIFFILIKKLYFYGVPLFSLIQNFSLYLWIHLYSYTRNQTIIISFSKSNYNIIKTYSLLH